MMIVTKLQCIYATQEAMRILEGSYALSVLPKIIVYTLSVEYSNRAVTSKQGLDTGDSCMVQVDCSPYISLTYQLHKFLMYLCIIIYPHCCSYKLLQIN